MLSSRGPRASTICQQLATCQLAPGIQKKGGRHDNPQGIQEDKVEPKVEWVSKLPMLKALSVLSEEIKDVTVQLTQGNNKLEKEAFWPLSQKGPHSPQAEWAPGTGCHCLHAYSEVVRQNVAAVTLGVLLPQLGQEALIPSNFLIVEAKPAFNHQVHEGTHGKPADCQAATGAQRRLRGFALSPPLAR